MQQSHAGQPTPFYYPFIKNCLWLAGYPISPSDLSLIWLFQLTFPPEKSLLFVGFGECFNLNESKGNEYKWRDGNEWTWYRRTWEELKGNERWGNENKQKPTRKSWTTWFSTPLLITFGSELIFLFTTPVTNRFWTSQTVYCSAAPPVPDGVSANVPPFIAEWETYSQGDMTWEGAKRFGLWKWNSFP